MRLVSQLASPTVRRLLTLVAVGCLLVLVTAAPPTRSPTTTQPLFTCDSYSVSSTNNAQANYATCTFNVCQSSQSAVITSCADGVNGQCVGDQFIRLYKGSTLAATNDDRSQSSSDPCETCSRLVITPPTSGCVTYTLREGCYGSSNCGGQFIVIGGTPVHSPVTSAVPTYKVTSLPSFKSTVTPSTVKPSVGSSCTPTQAKTSSPTFRTSAPTVRTNKPTSSTRVPTIRTPGPTKSTNAPSTRTPSTRAPSRGPTKSTFAPTATPMIVAKSSSPSTSAGGKAYTYSADIGAPRYQWEANFGYCGELSFIQGGLMAGQYFSQYDVRSIYYLNDQNNQYASGVGQLDELLLSGSTSGPDVKTLTALRLNGVVYPSRTTSSTSFLGWIKTQLRLGYAVTIGVYCGAQINACFPSTGNHGCANTNSGYDHIVTVTSIQSNYADNSYHADDIITFDDHGLAGGTSAASVPYLWSYPLSTFQGSRSASQRAGISQCFFLPSDTQSYGIALTGAMDPTKELLPVRIDTMPNYDSLSDISYGSTASRPAAVTMTMKVTISGLTVGTSYNLYRYSLYTSVPTSSFNAAYKASPTSATLVTFTAQATTNVLTYTSFTTAQQVIFRCVPSNGA